MFKQIKSCFAQTPVNTGRQRELDIAKGWVIILMAFSHGLEILGWFFDPQIQDGFFWHGFDMLIKGTAPVFIFCMGISLCYSRKQSAGELFRRGIRTAGIVVLLEFFRTVVPCFVEWLIFRDLESIGYINQVFCVDILQFATMAILAIALMKKLRLNSVAMLTVAVICSVIGQLLQGVTTGSVPGDYAAGFLWNTHYAAYFPFLNWLIVPVIGYVFGQFWLRLQDKKTFFKWVTPISFGISILYYASMALVGEWYYFSGGNYCGIGILDVLFMFVIFFAILGACYYTNQWTHSVSNVFVSMGARVNSVYCIHWVIYAFLYVILVCVLGEDQYLPLWTVVPAAVLVLIAADFLSRLYKKYLKKKKVDSSFSKQTKS